MPQPRPAKASRHCQQKMLIIMMTNWGIHSTVCCVKINTIEFIKQGFQIFQELINNFIKWLLQLFNINTFGMRCTRLIRYNRMHFFILIVQVLGRKILGIFFSTGGVIMLHNGNNCIIPGWRNFLLNGLWIQNTN